MNEIDDRWATEQIRLAALDLAVQTMAQVDSSTNVRGFILDTAEEYLTWIFTGKRSEGVAPVAEEKTDG
jgi:hypothetical protein